MKCMSLLMIAVLVAGISVAAIAQDAPKADNLRGRVVKVDGTNLTISVKQKDSTDRKEVVVKTDDKTTVTIDDKEAKLADLKADMRVTITPADGVATKIVAKTAKPAAPK
jgi:hypothetical protein